jgi:hypothetical protein
MSADPSDRLAAALQLVGRLTAAQAAELLSITPALAGRRLRALTRSGLALEWHGAWWAPGTPRTLERHRGLVADVYVRLARDARLVRFGVEVGEPRVRPDVTVVWQAADRPLTLAVEADAGTERRRHWHEKLARYAADPPDGLVVVVPDARRRERLRAWLADAPCPVLVTLPEGLPALLADLPKPEAASATSDGTPPPTPIPRVYRLGDRPLPAEEAARLLSIGHVRIGAEEREAGLDIVHLVPTRRRPR